MKKMSQMLHFYEFFFEPFLGFSNLCNFVLL